MHPLLFINNVPVVTVRPLYCAKVFAHWGNNLLSGYLSISLPPPHLPLLITLTIQLTIHCSEEILWRSRNRSGHWRQGTFFDSLLNTSNKRYINFRVKSFSPVKTIDHAYFSCRKKYLNCDYASYSRSVSKVNMVGKSTACHNLSFTSK